MNYTLIGSTNEIKHGERVQVLSKAVSGWKIQTEDGREAVVSHTRLRFHRPKGQLKGWEIRESQS